jgi:hypothetical protein
MSLIDDIDEMIEICDKIIGSKYDSLSMDCFGKPYSELEADEQITIRDIFDERNE